MVSALFLALALPVASTTTPPPTPSYSCFSQPHVMLDGPGAKVCTPSDDGWANVDMDSIGTTDSTGATTGQDISIEFLFKNCSEVRCTLEDRSTHGETVGDFVYQQINGRYVLDCAQTAGEKTIMIKVTRPSEITEFGAEWVKAYEKDSWTNITNEYEPFTFNDFGSKIPLQEFRPTTKDVHGRTIVDDAAPVESIHVFMVMDKVGDYEVRYGNPNLYASDPSGIDCGENWDAGATNCAKKWIAIEFKKHQLRVGSPWALCSDTPAAGINSASYDGIGTMVPVYLGNPALNLHAYKDIAETIRKGPSIPTKIILPIFAPDNDGADKDPLPGVTTVVGVAGLTWTEGFVPCNADDTACKARNMLWEMSAQKAAGDTEAKKGNKAYHCDSRWVDRYQTVADYNGPSVTDEDTEDQDNGPICVKRTYTSCFKSGASCPLDQSVCSPENCELQRWREIVDMYQDIDDNVEVLALVETKNIDGSTRSKDEIEADIALYKAHVPAIKGFYFNQVGTQIQGASQNEDCLSKWQSDEGNAKDKNKDKVAECTRTHVAALIDIVQDTLKSVTLGRRYFVSFGVGEPLFDTSAVVEMGSPGIPAVDLWVTLNDDAASLGVWTPYSWFSSLSNGYTFSAANWGALVTSVTTVTDYAKSPDGVAPASIMTTLFDRGYGYVYLTDQDFFDTTNEKLGALISGINGMTRRLTEEAPKKRFLQDVVDTGVARTKFQCDDTLFECKPVCVESNGVVFNKVPDSKCAGPKPDECSCRCFYDAYWTCEADKIVCKAKIQGGDEQTVGDLVCSTRGTPKPQWDLTAAERAAGVCAPLSVQREMRPAEQCLAEYAVAKELRQQGKQEVELPAPAVDLEINILDAGAPVSMVLGALLALYF